MPQNLQNYHKITEVIEKVSQSRKYQKWLIAFFLIFAFSMHFTGSVTLYLFNNPVFKCINSTKLIEEKQACNRLSQCQIYNDYLLTAHLHLYCGESTLSRNMIRTMKGLGQWLGIIFIGLVTDIIGKKNCIRIGLILANLWYIALFAGSYWNNRFLLGFSYLFYGIGIMSFQQIAYVHITRFLQKKSYQQLTVFMFFTGTGVALTSFGLITSLVKNWVALVLIASIPLLTLLPLSIIVREDPYFLLETGEVEQCKQIVRYIGKFNQTSDLIIEEQVQIISQIRFISSARKGFFSCGSILDNIPIWKVVFLLSIVYFGNHVSEGSFNFTVQQIGYSYQGNLIVMGLAALCGTSAFLYVLKYQSQRKRGYIISTVIQFSLCCLYLVGFISDSKIAQILLLFTIKFFSVWATNFFTRLQVDCLPKSYQVTLIGVILLIGKIAVIIEPHIIQYESDKHICAIVLNNLIKMVLGVGALLLMTERYYHINENKPQEFQEIEQNDF